jgi:hypothetical protein
MVHVPSRLRLILAAVIVFAVVGGLAPLGHLSHAQAAENDGWAVFPTATSAGTTRNQFILDLKPGVAVHDSVTITNKTADAITFQTYAADAYNTDVGQFSLRLNDQPKEGIGAWVQMSASDVVVGPGASVDVPFVIDVPADATPGDHAGGIVTVNPKGVLQEGGDVDVNVIQAVGVRIYGRVAGPLAPALDVTRLDLQTHTGLASLLGGTYDATVTYTITNTGNVRLIPTVVGTLSGLLGTTADIPINELPELLPGGSATVVSPVGGLRPTGKLTAKVTVTAAGIDPVTRATSAWVIPWVLLILVGLAIVGLVAGRRRRRRTRAARAAALADEPGPAGDAPEEFVDA